MEGYASLKKSLTSSRPMPSSPYSCEARRHKHKALDRRLLLLLLQEGTTTKKEITRLESLEEGISPQTERTLFNENPPQKQVCQITISRGYHDVIDRQRGEHPLRDLWTKRASEDLLLLLLEWTRRSRACRLFSCVFSFAGNVVYTYIFKDGNSSFLCLISWENEEAKFCI
jgi:hypothetical protein